VITFPLRVRLYGGRNTHAARAVNGGPGRVTACDHYVDATSANHWMPDTNHITCPACTRAIRKEATT
jgi:hypothetical protein